MKIYKIIKPITLHFTRGQGVGLFGITNVINEGLIINSGKSTYVITNPNGTIQIEQTDTDWDEQRYLGKFVYIQLDDNRS